MTPSQDENQFMEEELRKSEQTVLELNQISNASSKEETLEKLNRLKSNMQNLMETVEDFEKRRSRIQGRLRDQRN